MIRASIRGVKNGSIDLSMREQIWGVEENRATRMELKMVTLTRGVRKRKMKW